MRFSLFFQTLAGRWGQWFSVALGSLLFNLIRLRADALLRSPWHVSLDSYRLAATRRSSDPSRREFHRSIRQFYASRAIPLLARSIFFVSLSVPTARSNSNNASPLCSSQSMMTESGGSRCWLKPKLNAKREVSANSKKSDSCVNSKLCVYVCVCVCVCVYVWS